VKRPQILPTDAALLRRTITQNLSDDEHALFLLACQRSGLDPFARQIYFMWSRGKFVIEATIDGFRISAERTGKYAGQVGPEWCGPDGKWSDIWTGAQPPTAARVGILRQGFAEPVWGKALYGEYAQEGRFWQNMATNQLAKCAEALGFRKAFPQEFSGLYTPEEMAQSISDSQRQTSVVAIGDSERGSGPTFPPAPVPLPLQPFVINGGVGTRRNAQAAFGFLQGELIAALGPEQGTATFRRIYLKLPRIFKTKEACSKATLACWLEMWAAIPAKEEREAA
jgi:phage recombination protein Bet